LISHGAIRFLRQTQLAALASPLLPDQAALALRIRSMKLVLNGEEREFAGNLTLAGLLDQLGLKADRVAIELNRDIVPRDRWADIALKDADQLEIVHFVGGG